LEEVDEQKKSSSSEYETDEEWEVERKKHLANEEKNKASSCVFNEVVRIFYLLFSLLLFLFLYVFFLKTY
jgi:hypothetical protein